MRKLAVSVGATALMALSATGIAAAAHLPAGLPNCERAAQTAVDGGATGLENMNPATREAVEAEFGAMCENLEFPD